MADILTSPAIPSAALVSIDVRTGDWWPWLEARTSASLSSTLPPKGSRQPGSAFKPFVLATALQQGLSPDTPTTPVRSRSNCPSGPWDVSSTDNGPSR